MHKVGPEVHPSGRQSDAFTIDDTVEAAEVSNSGTEVY